MCDLVALRNLDFINSPPSMLQRMALFRYWPVRPHRAAITRNFHPKSRLSSELPSTDPGRINETMKELKQVLDRKTVAAEKLLAEQDVERSLTSLWSK